MCVCFFIGACVCVVSYPFLKGNNKRFEFSPVDFIGFFLINAIHLCVEFINLYFFLFFIIFFYNYYSLFFQTLKSNLSKRHKERNEEFTGLDSQMLMVLWHHIRRTDRRRRRVSYPISPWAFFVKIDSGVVLS